MSAIDSELLQEVVLRSATICESVASGEEAMMTSGGGSASEFLYLAFGWIFPTFVDWQGTAFVAIPWKFPVCHGSHWPVV